MEEAFENLKQQKLNGVDNLVKWMNDAKIFDQFKVPEDQVNKLFEDVKDKQNVQYEEFQQIVSKFAQNQNLSIEQLSKMLADGLPDIQEAVMAAASAFKGALGSK